MASKAEQLAEIIDECEHGSTAAFCPVCKANTRGGEWVARQRRKRNDAAWGTDVTIPYPSTTAEYRSICRGCDEWIEEGDTIYRVADDRRGSDRTTCWSCEDCARDCAIVGGVGCCG